MRMFQLLLAVLLISNASFGVYSPGPAYNDDNLGKLGSPSQAVTNLGFTATAAQLNALHTALDGVTATPTELNLVVGADKVQLVKKVALGAVRTGGGVAAWTPGAARIINKIVLNITTQSTGASTIDCGIAANATTLSDILIDGASGAAITVLDSIKNAGTNGVADGVTTSSTAVTCSEASGDVTGLAGFAYIYYHAL